MGHDRHVERARLLVVDDDPAAVEVARRHLVSMVVDITSANSGADGIEAAKKATARGEPFDVVLLDFYMPGMGGLDALKVMREQGVDARVILTSGQEPGEVAVEAMRHGAFDFISKPVN